jgi:heat shock protein HtpX
MIVCSYLFILILAAICVYGPYWLLVHSNSLGFQLLAVFICGFLMAATMLWSLVPRRNKFQTPGPLLERASHPKLFAELNKIASFLNEPVPHEVYLIPEVNAWVTERRGILSFRKRRILGIGLPLLSVLTVSELRAVLAHEFAHYYAGDTRLGPIVYRTRIAMARALENMASIGKYVRWILAQAIYISVMWILRWYWKLFFRLTQLVSRRPEYRADELACYIAGTEAMSTGLKKISASAQHFLFIGKWK